MNPTIYLARHGESAWNAENRIAGQLDPPLSPLGEEQARLLGELARRHGVSAFCASGLTRSVRTAQIAAADSGLPVEQIPELQERCFGTLQGWCRGSAGPQLADWRQWQERGAESAPPGGESLAQLRDRVAVGLARVLEIARRDGATLVVGHRHVNKVLLELVLGSENDAFRTARVKHRTVFRLTLGSPPRLKKLRLE